MSNRFEIIATPIAGLQVMQRKPMGDERGFLERLFCTTDLRSVLGDRAVVQVNHTLTGKKGTLRGMHFQYPPHAEMKLVSCLRGEVFDVAVDIRADSPTFLNWHGEIISAENHKTMVIPEGFAHGFQTLTDNCQMLYFHTENYNAESEGGLNGVDARLNIKWPLPISEQSPRDMAHSNITPDFTGVSL